MALGLTTTERFFVLKCPAVESFMFFTFKLCYAIVYFMNCISKQKRCMRLECKRKHLWFVVSLLHNSCSKGNYEINRNGHAHQKTGTFLRAFSISVHSLIGNAIFVLLK